MAVAQWQSTRAAPREEGKEGEGEEGTQKGRKERGGEGKRTASGSQRVAPEATVPAIPGNLVDMPFLRPHPRTLNLKLEGGWPPKNLCFREPSRGFWCYV